MTSMISHYFKLATRDLIKNKYYTFINVFGLVFGMLSALIIAKYIGGSLQFDSFHERKENIYAITQDESVNGSAPKTTKGTYWGVGELVSQYPEVIKQTRYAYHIESLIIAEGVTGNRISFLENKIFSVDSAFLNIFTFPLIYGNSRTALSKANSIVVTSAVSRRYFGNLNPIGKTLTVRVPWGSETTYEVTGVIDEVPRRSQFQFDFLIAQVPLDPAEFWYVPDCSTYMLLKPQANTDEFSKKLSRTLNEMPQFKSTYKSVTLSLNALAEVSLSGTDYLLISIGVFIIIISWVNYINQVIAQSYWRVKEIGILRVMGATKVSLKTQFVVESSLVCLTSLIVVVAIYFILEPSLQTFTDGRILPLLEDATPINLIFTAVYIIGIIISATIPTLILFLPNFGTTLQNAYSGKVGSIWLRQMLVVVQFSISTILMVSVFVISNQLEYMNGKDKGIDMESVLILQAPIVRDTTWNVKRKTLETFKTKCAELPFVTQVTSSTTVPSEEYRQETYLSLEGSSGKTMVHQNGVDDHFFELYDVKFISGHNFISDAMWKNKSSIILNESAARDLGIIDFDKMINVKITDHESNEVYDLIGIVKNYHQTSVKYEMRPLAFKFNLARGHISLRINKEGLSDVELNKNIGAIKEIWEQAYQDASFNFFFLDEKYSAQDREDQYFGKLFKYFTILSIAISCLGLFGLSLLISTKRQREIGVRKVFGATSFNILAIFFKGYLAPLWISVVVGSPLAYLLMNLWLRNYAYRIEIGFGLISTAIVSLITIFLFTVSYHTIKSCLTNPVTTLRDR